MIKEIKLSKINDPRGNLSFFQNYEQIPFKIKRIYWIYDVPGGESRNGHAYKKSEEFIIAISGSFDVKIKFKKKIISYNLQRPNKGLYIPNLTWRSITNFSTNSVALIVSSTKFNNEDYLRDFEMYKTLAFE